MTCPQALAGRREYLEAGLTELACDGCGARVLVKKNSPMHTSVQWSRPAAAQCAEFAARREPAALVDTCATLQRSIESAVQDGRLTVASPATPTAGP